MKPLPFDMTPLARSLSLAPAVRRNPFAPTAPGADVITAPAEPIEEVLQLPVVEPPAFPPEEFEPKFQETKVQEAKVQEASVQETSVEETTVEEALVEEPDLPDSRAQSEQREDNSADAAPEEETPVDSAVDANSTPKLEDASADESPKPEPKRAALAAGSHSAAPATELRTATYPQHLKAFRGWSSSLAQEQIHALATHVLARHTEQNLRTLAVTSALAGEGKTTVTLALAEKLAKAGKRVLILDLDAHRATLSRESGLEDAAGALQSSDPRDPANMDFHVYSSDIPGLSIMPAGYPDVNADGPPIISAVHIGILVLRALDDFEFIILDCPPLLPVADTHVIGEVVDKALLVVRAGSTPRDMLDQAIDEFGRDKFFGAVLNRARPEDIPYFREVYGYYRRDSARG